MESQSDVEQSFRQPVAPQATTRDTQPLLWIRWIDDFYPFTDPAVSPAMNCHDKSR